MAYDLLVRNATIVDGTGAPRRSGAVATQVILCMTRASCDVRVDEAALGRRSVREVECGR